MVAGFLLVSFVLLFPLLAYFPINLQRRLPDGIWWILIALAVIGLGELDKRWRLRLPGSRHGWNSYECIFTDWRSILHA